MDESGFFFFPLSSNASLYVCWAYVSSCRIYYITHIYIYALGMRLDVIRTLSWYLLQNTPPGLCRIAGMAGIQINCYLGADLQCLSV